MHIRQWLVTAVVATLVILAGSAPANAKDTLSDTVYVKTFDQEFINWATPHIETFSFPAEGGNWGQILLQMTIGCPESPADCDPWDRLGHLRVIEMEGKDEVHYEIARFITPYDITGGAYPGTCTWVMDVSDYETLLHDDVTLRLYIESWMGNDNGWLITCDFLFFPGVSELEPYSVTNLWFDDYIIYGHPEDPIESYLAPMLADIDAEAVGAKVRTWVTGHGFGNTDNAAEFSYKWHEIVAESDSYQDYIWRSDCNVNPCSPQGGTWRYARNGWCPGDKVIPWDVDITTSVTPGEAAVIDYNVQPYENFCRPTNPDCVDGVTCPECEYNNRQPPIYTLNSQLILYRERSSSIRRLVVAGAGPAYDNPPAVRAFPTEQDVAHEEEFTAYGAGHYGVNVTCGRVTGDGTDTILTGAGPGNIYGPHVRGFQVDGMPLAGLSFLAYGTNRWGVNVAAGDIDNDGYDEIITGAGPGRVFGPHVRAFNYDGGSTVTPVPGVSYFSYGTLKYGVNVTSGDIDGDGYDEIVTGAGPGNVFGAHVRGWNVDGGAVAAIPNLSYFAYGTPRFGVRVACGDMDADGIDEIITAPGPSSAFGAHIRGWNYDGVEVEELSGFSVFAWTPAQARYGAQIYADANLDGTAGDELIVGGGPDPSLGTPVKVYTYDGEQLSEWFSLQAFPDGWTEGATVAAGWFMP